MSCFTAAHTVFRTWKLAFPLITMCIAAGCNSQPAPTVEAKIACRSPNKPNAPPTAVEKWKFDLIHEAILAVLRSEPDGTKLGGIVERLPEFIPGGEIERLRNVEWLTEKVRLEMEVRGEIKRVKSKGGASRLLLADSNVEQLPDHSARNQ
jgi:hypothetical protein